MAELLCRSTIEKLLKNGINYRDYKRLIQYLKSQIDAPMWDIAFVWTPEVREKFWYAMGELQRELVPQYIDINSLYNKLWGLFREVVLNKPIYEDSATLKSKVSDFANEVKKPLVAYEVLYTIKHFSIGKRPIKLGNVEIFELTEDYLRSPELVQSLIDEKWVGKPVVKIIVEATEIGNALEAGRATAESTLHLLRVAVRKESLSEPEYMFLWELGPSIAVPREKPRDGTAWAIGGDSKISPFTINMGDKIAKSLSDTSIWNYVIENEIPEDIKRRVMRAIEWISHSITGESFDYKLVNLCVALEILLLPEEKGGASKGALIALRQVLVGQNTFCEPKGILNIYKLRNAIIHGGYLNITSRSDYLHFLARCLSVLERIVRLSQKYPEVDNLRALLDKVENKETLQKFIEDYNLGRHKCREAKEAAERLLKKYD